MGAQRGGESAPRQSLHVSCRASGCPDAAASLPQQQACGALGLGPRGLEQGQLCPAFLIPERGITSCPRLDNCPPQPTQHGGGAP